jgi:hypothetical protein
LVAGFRSEEGEEHRLGRKAEVDLGPAVAVAEDPEVFQKQDVVVVGLLGLVDKELTAGSWARERGHGEPEVVDAGVLGKA